MTKLVLILAGVCLVTFHLTGWIALHWLYVGGLVLLVVGEAWTWWPKTIWRDGE